MAKTVILIMIYGKLLKNTIPKNMVNIMIQQEQQFTTIVKEMHILYLRDQKDLNNGR